MSVVTMTKQEITLNRYWHRRGPLVRNVTMCRMYNRCASAKSPVLTVYIIMAVGVLLLKAHRTAKIESIDHTYQYRPDSVTFSIWPVMHQTNAAMTVNTVTNKLRCQSLMLPVVRNRIPASVKKHHPENNKRDFVSLAAWAIRPVNVKRMAKRAPSGIAL